MARAVYSTRFIALSVSESSSETYTVPDGFVAVLVDMQLYIGGGATAGWAVSLVDPLCYLWNGVAPSSAATSVWPGRRAVFNAGDQLEAQLFTAALASVVCSGYLLSV
jgi:hypothetical protein